MTMTIGKEARDALTKAIDELEPTYIPAAVRQILSRSTDADEIEQEPVAWRAEVNGQWFVSKTESALRCALSDAGVARKIEPLYTRQPVGFAQR